MDSIVLFRGTTDLGHHSSRRPHNASWWPAREDGGSVPPSLLEQVHGTLPFYLGKPARDWAVP